MLAGLKEMLPGQAKPPPASATPGAPAQGAPPPEPPEGQQPEEALNPPGADGAEPLNEAEVEKMLFDEYLG